MKILNNKGLQDKILSYVKNAGSFQWLVMMIMQFSLVAIFIFLPLIQSVSVLLIFLVAFIFLLKPEWAAYILIFLVPILSNYVGFYFVSTGIGAKSTKTMPMFTIFLILGMIGLVVKKSARLHESIPLIGSWAIPICFLVVYAYISLLWAPYTAFGHATLLIIIINFILCFYFIKVITDESMHKRLMICWVCVGVITSGLTILSLYNIPLKMFYSYKISDSIIFIYNNTTKFLYRGHAYGHPNVASTILNMTTCVTIGLLLTEKTRWKLIILWGALIIILFGNLLTLSKAGLGSLVVMLLFLMVMVSKLRKKLFINTVKMVIGVSLIFLFSFVYYQNTISRNRPFRLFTLSAPSSNEIASLQHRIEFWKKGWAQMDRRNLILLGLGPGGFEKTTHIPHSHNLYFSFFFDLGVAGVIFELIILAVLIRYIWVFLRKYYKQQNSYLQIMSMSFIGGIVALAIHSTVDQYYYKSIIWLFMALAIITFSLMKIESIEKESQIDGAK